jgi:hypothetical protein
MTIRPIIEVDLRQDDDIAAILRQKPLKECLAAVATFASDYDPYFGSYIDDVADSYAQALSFEGGVCQLELMIEEDIYLIGIDELLEENLNITSENREDAENQINQMFFENQDIARRIRSDIWHGLLSSSRNLFIYIQLDENAYDEHGETSPIWEKQLCESWTRMAPELAYEHLHTVVTNSQDCGNLGLLLQLDGSNLATWHKAGSLQNWLRMTKPKCDLARYSFANGAGHDVPFSINWDRVEFSPDTEIGLVNNFMSSVFSRSHCSTIEVDGRGHGWTANTWFRLQPAEETELLAA